MNGKIPIGQRPKGDFSRRLRFPASAGTRLSPFERLQSDYLAGYSGKNLVQKLGLKTGDRALLVEAPTGYDRTLGDLPKGLVPKRAALAKLSPATSPLDFIQCFCRSEGDLRAAFPALKRSLDKAGMLWISWPKKTALSREEAEDPDRLDEDKVRALGLGSGLVDVKVCAVDETWSGLKFMYRRADR